MRHPWRLLTALGAVAIVSGGAVAAATGAFGQNHSPSAQPQRASTSNVGPGNQLATALSAQGYRLDLGWTPNRAAVAGTVSLLLSKQGKPVNRARVRLTFTMLDMDMGGLTGLLPQTAPGRYAHAGPILRMGGRWRLRLDVAPHRGNAFHIDVIDRIGP
jgi:hypothetical protein